MALADKIPALVKLVKDRDGYIAHNADLYEIYQGNLLPYIEEALKAQLSAQSYAMAMHRIPPINALKRIVDKLAKVYSNPPQRVVEGTEQEAELFSWYVQSFKLNQRMALSNAYFNLFKNALIEPFIHQPDPTRPGKPQLRIIPSDKFVAYSEDHTDPSYPTGVIVLKGHYQPTPTGQKRRVFCAVENEQFVYFDEDKRNVTAFYSPENPEGINPYGVLPYVYLNRSDDCIMPIQDTDTKRMAILIPTLLADTNYASMFQAFSVLYGIDVSDQGLSMSPNAFWSFKTEPGADSKPQVGTLTPQMNVDGSLNLIASQLAFWLNSRGIKPGSIGDINGSNFSSGIAKMIDEMDTAEDRKAQVPYFEYGEEQLWDLVLHKMHPVWQQQGLIDQTQSFSQTSKVNVIFPDQIQFVKRGELIKEAIDELNNGLTTKKRAIQRINPDLTEAELDALIVEIGVPEIVVPDAGPPVVVTEPEPEPIEELEE